MAERSANEPAFTCELCDSIFEISVSIHGPLVFVESVLQAKQKRKFRDGLSPVNAATGKIVSIGVRLGEENFSTPADPNGTRWQIPTNLSGARRALSTANLL